DALLGSTHGYEPPSPLPEVGIYHPDHAGVLEVATWLQRFHRPGRPTVGIAFYRAHWVTGNLAPVDAMIQALETRGLNVLASFGPNRGAVLASGLLPAGVIDVLITTTSFSALSPPHAAGSTSLDVPVLQAIFCSSSENVWAANIAGLS